MSSFEGSEIIYHPQKRRKSLSLRFDQSENVFHFYYPDFISRAYLLKFLMDKQKWMEKVRKTNAGKIILKIEDLPPRNEIFQFFKQRLDEISLESGLNYRKLRLRKMKSRWGSCSADNEITLNTLTFLLPANLRDFILYHELCHTKIKNHSIKFYELLRKHVPEERKRNRELKDYILT
ncbi:MAG: M48 family metallopeptidase [Leptospiraceae bacterium]|nr:M48 family metallopeptidase [Leptospiraceae bacterium]MCP5511816.1 M48 family metallopeptidase [Leptospiraceae bacterium]